MHICCGVWCAHTCMDGLLQVYSRYSAFFPQCKDMLIGVSKLPVLHVAFYALHPN